MKPVTLRNQVRTLSPATRRRFPSVVEARVLGSPATGTARRDFLKTALAGCVGLTLPMTFGEAAELGPGARGSLRPFMGDLLRDWCNGLVRVQIREPGNPERHGAFACPACRRIHGRAGDAVYPLLNVAKSTGESRYLDAALLAYDWMKNVELPDGSWKNDPGPGPGGWTGITVFGAIAFCEALHYHGDLLDPAVKERWRARLKRAADFIHEHFTISYSNINYGITGAYALALLGRLFDEPKYRAHGRELAHAALRYISRPTHLVFGEGKPADQLSPKQCPAVDLGYNVEESLPSLALYARLEQDAEVLEAVVTSLRSHLQFMLPDGGWDNGWGTRSFKWTYWGSRTSDGCQGALVLLADRDPAFAAAAYRNTKLMRDCTHDGLLYGGPHLKQQGLPPCVHHTFTHAKALACVLDHCPEADKLDLGAPLPREKAQGVILVPEIDTRLAAFGPWRATVTGYDWAYRANVWQATGGALAFLFHLKLGPICTASLARYVLVEERNMQRLPDGADFPLTPRIELERAGRWFTNLYDRGATISHETKADALTLTAQTQLLDENTKSPQAAPARFTLSYRLTAEQFVFTATPLGDLAGNWSLVLPVISPSGEAVQRRSERQYEVVKPGGSLVVETTAPLRALDAAHPRVFNLVPGFQAIPFVLEGAGAKPLEVRLRAKLS